MIREPEISKEALIEIMRQHIKADAVGLAPAVIAHYLVGFEEAADAILNLAPVAKGAGAEPGAGWVYNSPDTGMEYSTEHPLESGEIPDATDVRRSTFFEDWMFGEIGRLAAKVRELVVNLAPVGGRGEGWRPISEAPRDGSPILAASTNHEAREVVCWQDGEDSGSIDADAVCEGWVNAGEQKDRFYANPRWFTHWQPLPPPPQEQEDGSSQSQPVLSPKSDIEDDCAICGGSEIVALGNSQYEDCACAEGSNAGLEKDWPISTDGHHSISNIRRWMARQLMDSGLSEDEALGIVAYHPAITDLSGAQRSELAGQLRDEPLPPSGVRDETDTHD